MCIPSKGLGEAPVPYQEGKPMSTVQRMKTWKGSVFLAAAVAAITFGPAPVEAAVVSFMTPAGASVGDGPVSARADITTSNGSVLITLTDLLANPTSVGQ